MIGKIVTQSPRNRQQGVALIMALAFLMILTIIGVTALSTTSLQEKMAGNVQDKHTAFQAAESALRQAESVVEGWASKPDFTVNTNGLFMPQPAGTDPWWYSVDWTDTTNTVLAYTGTIAEVNQLPAYIIEDLGSLAGSTGGTGSIVTGFAPPAATSGGASMYRITARGVGRSDSAVAVVQSVYRK